MLEKKPKTILTDQDVAMSKVISLVILESYLSHLYKNSYFFDGDFDKLIYE